jgi:hypothetical protein
MHCEIWAEVQLNDGFQIFKEKYLNWLCSLCVQPALLHHDPENLYNEALEMFKKNPSESVISFPCYSGFSLQPYKVQIP